MEEMDKDMDTGCFFYPYNLPKDIIHLSLEKRPRASAL